MRINKLDIIKRFLPLAWDTFIVIFLAFNIRIEGMNLVVSNSCQFVLYIHLAVILLTFGLELVFTKKFNNKGRVGFLILFLVLALSIPPLLKNWQLFYTFLVIHAGVDLLLILGRMVLDSLFSEVRLLNQKLPVNQFNYKRKLVARIVTISSFIILFVISFVVFYYNEVSLEALVILCFVGIIIATIGQILSLSISLKPMAKYEGMFKKSLDFTTLENNLLALDDERLHEETKNLIRITLWKYASFINLAKAEEYQKVVHIPQYEGNKNKYYEALFWYSLQRADFAMIKQEEKHFKKAIKPHKLFKAYLHKINGGTSNFKFRKKLNSLEKMKKELYLELEKNIIEK